MDISVVLKDFITMQFMHELDHQVLGDEDPLIEGGIVDSMGLVRLLSFIEEKFGIQIEGEDVVIENFQSVRAIKEFLQEKMPARLPSPKLVEAEGIL